MEEKSRLGTSLGRQLIVKNLSRSRMRTESTDCDVAKETSRRGAFKKPTRSNELKARKKRLRKNLGKILGKSIEKGLIERLHWSAQRGKGPASNIDREL